VRDEEVGSGRERYEWLRTKRFFALLAVLAVVLATARCGGSPRTTSSTTIKATVPPTKAVRRPKVVPRGDLRITTTSLPNAVQRTRYSVQLTAKGGTVPYHWKKVSPLPKGFRLVLSRKGVLHGTPTKKATPGTYTLKVLVQDRAKETATATLTLHLSAP
jgi:hypothetical protein